MPNTVPFGKNTLYGLSGVAVTAELLSNDAHDTPDLDAEKLRQAVEYQLYQAGIGVYSLDGLALVPQKPILHSKISVLPAGGPNRVYAVNLFLMQLVTLYQGSPTLSVTWEHGFLGIEVEPGWTHLLKSLEQTVIHFCQEFQEANQ